MSPLHARYHALMRELGSTLLLAERHYKPSGLTEEDKEKERVAAERGLRQAAPPVGNEEPCDIIGPIESKVRGVWRWDGAMLLCVPCQTAALFARCQAWQSRKSRCYGHVTVYLPCVPVVCVHLCVHVCVARAPVARTVVCTS